MKTLRILTILLLLFNGTGALFGGWSLISDPTGQDLHLPTGLLEPSPFTDFFIPGVVLFTSIGIFSFVALLWMTMQWKHYPLLLIIEGLLVTGWIIIQMILIRELSYLQGIFITIGIFFMLTGWRLKLKNEN